MDDARGVRRSASSTPRRSCPPLAAPRAALRRAATPIFEARGHREGDREGAAAAGVAQVGRLHRHRPHRGAGRRSTSTPASTSASATSRRRSSRSTSRRSSEIVRQIRLRDLGGIIIIDFIDMERRGAPRAGLPGAQAGAGRRQGPHERARDLRAGLVEMTRKRVRQSLQSLSDAPCPTCKGSGVVKSDATLAAEIFRKIQAGGEGGGRPGGGRPRPTRTPRTISRWSSARGWSGCRR